MTLLVSQNHNSYHNNTNYHVINRSSRCLRARVRPLQPGSDTSAPSQNARYIPGSEARTGPPGPSHQKIFGQLPAGLLLCQSARRGVTSCTRSLPGPESAARDREGPRGGCRTGPTRCGPTTPRTISSSPFWNASIQHPPPASSSSNPGSHRQTGTVPGRLPVVLQYWEIILLLSTSIYTIRQHIFG